jgi:hypothetical protein
VRVPGSRLLRRYERELVCARCPSVMAWVRLGLWSLMRIRDGSGAEVDLLGGGTAIRVAGEVVHELSCPSCRARCLRSLPDLTATVRRADSGRVVIG